MNAIEIKAADGIHPKALTNLQRLLAAGRRVPRREAVYVLTGVQPADQGMGACIGVCVALGIQTIDGRECPDNLTADEVARLQEQVSVLRQYMR